MSLEVQPCDPAAARAAEAAARATLASRACALSVGDGGIPVGALLVPARRAHELRRALEGAMGVARKTALYGHALFERGAQGGDGVIVFHLPPREAALFNAHYLGGGGGAPLPAAMLDAIAANDATYYPNVRRLDSVFASPGGGRDDGGSAGRRRGGDAGGAASAALAAFAARAVADGACRAWWCTGGRALTRQWACRCQSRGAGAPAERACSCSGGRCRGGRE